MTESEIRLKVSIEARDEYILELKSRIKELEGRNERMTQQLLEAVMAGRSTMATPVPMAQAAAGAPISAPIIGPKAQRAINAVAGRNRALGRELMEAANDVLAADPEITDEQLAAKIIDGESPDLAYDDEAVEEARGRVIPGGAE